MLKKAIIFCFLALSAFSMEIENRGKDIYLVKDQTDIVDDISPNKAKEQLLQSMRAELLKYVNGVDINSASIMERNSEGKALHYFFP